MCHNAHVYCLEGACIAANCNGIRRWIAQIGRRVQSKMWEFDVLMRDSGMSGVLRDIQAKSGMVGNYAVEY